MRFLTIVLLMCFLLPAGAVSRLITTTVGQVADHIVTSREVHITYMIEKILYGKTKGKAPKKLLEVKSNRFRREANAAMIEWVVFLEAKGFSVIRVSEGELGRARDKVMGAVVRSQAWQSLQVTRAELKEAIERKIRAKKFIRFKIDSSVVPITDAEAKAYFENNRLRFGNLPFENFKDNVKAYLGRQQVDRRLKDWFEVLQAKFKVKSFLVQ